MLDARRRAVLEAMDVDVWVLRHEAGAGEVTSPAETMAGDAADAIAASASPGRESPSTGQFDASSHDSIATLDWDALRRTVSTCQACGLHPTRTQTVFGVGNRNADLMIIGEAPGADEDRQGEPFVGRAGQLLNLMLEAIGFAREQVYIANIIKCRPPGNRDPHIEESTACQPYLHRQIAMIRPKLILSVGRISAHNLLGTEEPVGRLRGRVHRFEPGDIPLIVTYHPAYLLRKPQEKAKAWADLQAAYRLLRGDEAGS